ALAVERQLLSARIAGVHHHLRISAVLETEQNLGLCARTRQTPYQLNHILSPKDSSGRCNRREKPREHSETVKM
ncbi:hypothetical protein LEMLEM_LOCUS22762, partial [Lemmus lemmus]